MAFRPSLRTQVWFKDYAWVMNLMCAIPIFGIVMLVWLIANHEHVTCFNRKKVRDWAASAQRRGSNVDLAARVGSLRGTQISGALRHRREVVAVTALARWEIHEGQIT